MADVIGRIADLVASGPTPDPDARAVMEMSILDWMACGIAGADEPVARATRAAATAGGCAPVFGARELYPVGYAAQINGATSHALDYDDTHFAYIGHPSVVILPVVMALMHDRDGDIVLPALIGAEVAVRVGLWLGRSHYQAGFHQTATAGAFGGFAAAGYILGLSAQQMRMGFGLVASRAGGLKAQFGTMAKPMNAGFAAQAAVEAALLIQNAVTANPDAAEIYGDLSAGAADISALDRIGQDWFMMDVSHKFYACCHGLHAALEAFSTCDMDGLTAITVRTNPRWATVCNQIAPDTGLGAKFSYGTVLAMAASGVDTADLNSFAEPFNLPPSSVALRDKVTIVFDDAVSETAATVGVTYADGRTVTASHDLRAPQSLSVRQDKVMAKAAALIGGARAAEIQRALAGHNAGPTLAALM